MICFGYSEGDSTQVSANIPSLNNLYGQKSIKFLGGILENFQTSKGHSEINWPLNPVHYDFWPQNWQAKGHLNSKGIYEDIDFPK